MTFKIIYYCSHNVFCGLLDHINIGTVLLLNCLIFVFHFRYVLNKPKIPAGLQEREKEPSSTNAKGLLIQTF